MQSAKVIPILVRLINVRGAPCSPRRMAAVDL